MLQHLTHAKLVKDARRPPGMLESVDCHGRLFTLTARDPKLPLDGAQPREGGVNDEVPFELFECQTCFHRLPTVVGTDGKTHLRNDYNPFAARWVAPQPLSKDRSNRR